MKCRVLVIPCYPTGIWGKVLPSSLAEAAGGAKRAHGIGSTDLGQIEKYLSTF